jgi:hypothetical protein
MDVEKDHLDVLQNIEFAIVSVHQRQPALVDFDVDAALNALIAHYQSKAIDRPARQSNLNERAKQVYEMVQAMCDWRLGDETLLSADMKRRGPRPEPRNTEVIVACLKRIRKSVEKWNKQGGRQGYLTFVEQFVR